MAREMLLNRLGAIMLLLALLVLPAPAALALTSTVTDHGVAANLSPVAPAAAGHLALPLHFIPNQGQAAPAVKYYHQGPHQGIAFTQEGLWCRFSPPAGTAQRPQAGRPGPPKSAVVGLTPLNLRKETAIVPLDPQAGKVNYFLGNEPEKWRVDLPTYGAVLYREACRGIDLKFYGHGRQLEYDVIIRPGADPHQVKFQYHGVTALQVTPEGDLAIRLPDGGSLLQKKPVVYQDVDGRRVPRQGKFKIYRDSGRHIFGFTVARYDRSRPLVIDPVLVYSTYLGGSGEDAGKGIAVDAAGNAYVAGFTNSADFPTTPGVYQRNFKGIAPQGDAYVAKFSPAGALVFATYLGGTGGDAACGVALEWNGNIYLAGNTDSTDFPTTAGAVQPNYQGNGDAFMAKLTPDGTTLLFSTYLGGTGFEELEGTPLAVDAEGNAYVMGETGSGNFPVTPGAFQSSLGGGMDGFVAKLNHLGTSLFYSTYLGGNADDRGRAIAVDAQGNAYVTGETKSANFPTSSNPFQKNYQGNTDAFVTKFDTAGAMVYSGFLGGGNGDGGLSVAVDGSGNAYVTGFTYSDNFPTSPDAFQQTQAALSDAFVTKVDPTGAALLYSTYLGGAGQDRGRAIAVDNNGNAYIAGVTESENFPVLRALQIRKAGAADAFVAKFNTGGSSLWFSTYLGGDGADTGEGIALGSQGLIYVSGRTESNNFPVKNPYQAHLMGTLDAFVAKMQENDPTGSAVDLLLLGE